MPVVHICFNNVCICLGCYALLIENQNIFNHICGQRLVLLRSCAITGAEEVAHSIVY